MGRPPGNRQDLLQTFFKESGWGLSAPLEPPTPVGDPHLPSACLWYILYLLWSSALHPRAARGFYKSSPVLASATSTQEPEFLFVYPYGLYPSIQCYVVLLRYFVSGFQILRKMSLSHLTILAFSTCHVLRKVQAVNKSLFEWKKERRKRGENQLDLSNIVKLWRAQMELNYTSNPNPVAHYLVIWGKSFNFNK